LTVVPLFLSQALAEEGQAGARPCSELPRMFSSSLETTATMAKPQKDVDRVELGRSGQSNL